MVSQVFFFKQYLTVEQPYGLRRAGDSLLQGGRRGARPDFSSTGAC
jgi:hypothetical protein